ncbi:MAG: competence/damage-inducible protein A [Verrucomicrobiales bacterium]|jgi:nicotinamide-nucleotide amidase|nr:competence/damage-inducible protein A [Verrucomicrobiales bacterium]
MQLEVVNTGSELLLGQTLNTHLGYFAEQLQPLGVPVTRAQIVPDGPLIEAAIRAALARSEVVLVTGGLGPTSDDVTRDLVAKMLDAPLEFQPELLDKIYAYFARRKIVPSDLTRAQAFVPRGATVLPNNHGSAPGLWLQRDGRHVFCLPGPPRELRPMFENHTLPVLKKIFAGTPPLTVQVLRVYGIGESSVQERVEPAVRAQVADRAGLDIGYCARPGEVDVRFVAADRDLVNRAAALTRELLGDAVYADGDGTLEQAVIGSAVARGKTIATAESCTGGLVAHLLTNVPGASAVLQRGWVAYSNQAKMDELNVSGETLQQHGAVSAECAREMALGALTVSGCDLAIALTGLAGPGGGTAEQPVGTLFAGLAWRGADSHPRVETQHRLLLPNRADFKHTAAQFALNWLRLKLVEKI